MSEYVDDDLDACDERDCEEQLAAAVKKKDVKGSKKDKQYFDPTDEVWKCVYTDRPIGVKVSAKHNHITRDIKPFGSCSACDDYHNREVPTAPTTQAPLPNLQKVRRDKIDSLKRRHARNSLVSTNEADSDHDYYLDHAKAEGLEIGWDACAAAMGESSYDTPTPSEKYLSDRVETLECRLENKEAKIEALQTDTERLLKQIECEKKSTAVQTEFKVKAEMKLQTELAKLREELELKKFELRAADSELERSEAELAKTNKLHMWDVQVLQTTAQKLTNAEIENNQIKLQLQTATELADRLSKQQLLIDSLEGYLFVIKSNLDLRKNNYRWAHSQYVNAESALKDIEKLKASSV